MFVGYSAIVYMRKVVMEWTSLCPSVGTPVSPLSRPAQLIHLPALSRVGPPRAGPVHLDPPLGRHQQPSHTGTDTDTDTDTGAGTHTQREATAAAPPAETERRGSLVRLAARVNGTGKVQCLK